MRRTSNDKKERSDEKTVLNCLNYFRKVKIIFLKIKKTLIFILQVGVTKIYTDEFLKSLFSNTKRISMSNIVFKSQRDRIFIEKNKSRKVYSAQRGNFQ